MQHLHHLTLENQLIHLRLLVGVRLLILLLHHVHHHGVGHSHLLLPQLFQIVLFQATALVANLLFGQSLLLEDFQRILTLVNFLLPSLYFGRKGIVSSQLILAEFLQTLCPFSSKDALVINLGLLTLFYALVLCTSQL